MDHDLDPQHYRPKGEVEQAREREPLARLRELIDAQRVEELDAEVGERIDNAVARAVELPFPDPETALEHLYA